MAGHGIFRQGIMSEEATRRAPMLSLKQVVERYRAAASRFGDAVPLSSFGLTQQETQNLFSALDEDYHISRFLQFPRQEGTAYTISGSEATHVAIDAAIETIL
jgi:hypothetical protein